jgi:hypothetical protein
MSAPIGIDPGKSDCRLESDPHPQSGFLDVSAASISNFRAVTWPGTPDRDLSFVGTRPSHPPELHSIALQMK